MLPWSLLFFLSVVLAVSALEPLVDHIDISKNLRAISLNVAKVIVGIYFFLVSLIMIPVHHGNDSMNGDSPLSSENSEIAKTYSCITTSNINS